MYIRSPWNKILLSNFGNQLLQRLHKGMLRKGTPKLIVAAAPVPGCHAPESWKRKGRHQVSQANVSSAISLPPKRKHRIRASIDSATDAACEMHSQERQARVGHGIDERVHQSCTIRKNIVVF